MTGPRSRRALLRTGALALVGAAGCTGSPGDDAESSSPPASTTAETTTSTTTERPASRTETGTEAAVDLAARSVQSSFFYLTTADQMDVVGVEGRQFLFATVSASGEWPRPGAIELVADGERFRPTTTPGSVDNSYRLYEQGRAYDPDEQRSGWLAFEVPNPLDAESVALSYGDERRALAEEHRAELTDSPAEFELVSFDAPEEVAPDETFDVSVAVENVGEGGGTFRAVLNESGPSHVPHQFELSIPPGERAEWSRSFGEYVSAGTSRARYRFRSAVANRDHEVAVVSETTA